MQGSNFSREIEGFKQQAVPPRLPGEPQASGAVDPLRQAVSHLEASLRELRSAQEHIARQHGELDDTRIQIDALRWRQQQLGLAREGCLVTTAQWVIVEADLPAVSLLGLDRQRLVGASLQRFLPDDPPEALASLVEQAPDSKGLASREARVQPAEGEAFAAALHASPLRGSRGEILSVRWLIQDISLQKHAERRIREGEQRYRSLMEMTSDGVIVHREGRILLANPAAAAIVGAAPTAPLVGAAVSDLVHPDSRQTVERCLRASEGGTSLGLHEERLVRLDGSEICVELTMVPVVYEGTPASQILLRDVTERRRLQTEVVAISDLERGRIGQDLHDVLGQSLTAISFRGKTLETQLQRAGLAEAADAQTICDLAGEGMRQTRALARGMFPAEVRADALVSTLKALALDTEHTFHMACHFEPPANPDVLGDDKAATHLYHIAQEAITNAVKHGKARSAQVTLRVRDGHTVLTIRDDGAGFRPGDKGRGIGLRIMSHRVSLLGGTLSIESQPGQGTTVTCVVPGCASD